jgi:hypothetical protein
MQVSTRWRSQLKMIASALLGRSARKRDMYRISDTLKETRGDTATRRGTVKKKSTKTTETIIDFGNVRISVIRKSLNRNRNQ